MRNGRMEKMLFVPPSGCSQAWRPAIDQPCKSLFLDRHTPEKDAWRPTGGLPREVGSHVGRQGGMAPPAGCTLASSGLHPHPYPVPAPQPDSVYIPANVEGPLC